MSLFEFIILIVWAGSTGYAYGYTVPHILEKYTLRSDKARAHGILAIVVIANALFLYLFVFIDVME